MKRRDFLLGSALAMGTASAAPDGGRSAGSPAASGAGRAFFEDRDFDFIFRCLLGLAYGGGVDVGTCMAIAARIPDGDAHAAFQAFLSTGADLGKTADRLARAGHAVSARETYLHAANVTCTALYFGDGAGSGELLAGTFQAYQRAWDGYAERCDPPIERVQIPYEQTTLPGYFVRSPRKGRRPTLILNNGSDGSTSALWTGFSSALARGWNVLLFEGPGQGAALWLQKLFFRPDWEKVVTPVVDFLLKRPDVDGKRLALVGVSQGGYWVPRAAAFEQRLAAIVADPGVWDVSTSWTSHLPPEMTALLDSGNPAEFDRFMGKGGPEQRALLAFRMRPYGKASAYEVFKATQQYRLASVVEEIRCPVLITDPQGEQFWPGQSEQLLDALKSPKELLRFTRAEGADLHCEPLAPGLRAQRILDWLETTLRIQA